METHYRMVVTRGQDWGGWGVTAKLPAFLRGSEDFLELHLENMLKTTALILKKYLPTEFRGNQPEG